MTISALIRDRTPNGDSEKLSKIRVHLIFQKESDFLWTTLGWASTEGCLGANSKAWAKASGTYYKLIFFSNRRFSDQTKLRVRSQLTYALSIWCCLPPLDSNERNWLQLLLNGGEAHQAIDLFSGYVPAKSKWESPTSMSSLGKELTNIIRFFLFTQLYRKLQSTSSLNIFSLCTNVQSRFARLLLRKG